VRVPDSQVDPATDKEVREEWVSPRYFETLGMRLVLGRDFTPGDTAVAIINEAMMRRYFDRQNPLGKLIYFPKVDSLGRYVPFGRQLERDQAVEVVGVVADAKYDNLRQQTPALAYLPLASMGSALALRTISNPSAMVESIGRTLRGISPDLLVRNTKTLEDQINGTLFEERLIARLLGFFGLLALVLACVGLYGVMSHDVARRTREIGIRLALGAGYWDTLGAVLRETLLVAGIGVALGGPAALAAARLVERLLFGLAPSDPITLAAAALVLLAVAALAGYFPARRAARVDPVVALRHE
jgi:predicted permease